MDNDNIEFDGQTFNPIAEGDEDQCRALWLATIIQALLDATGRSGNQFNRAEALAWLEARGGITSDFAAVCGLANVDFQQTHEFVKKVLRGEIDVVDFRCMKKAKLENRSNESRKRYFRRVNKCASNRRAKREQRIMAAWSREKKLPANDNLCERAVNDNFINQPMEKTYE